MIAGLRFVISAAVMALGITGQRQQYNVFDEHLEICSTDPMTGWYRDGYAKTDEQDHGSHTVCAKMTEEVRQLSRFFLF